MAQHCSVLDPVHRALGARMFTFAGWEMPLQYTGILDEHNAVRTTAGLFDVSHLARFLVRGSGALRLLQGICTSDIARMPRRTARYSLLCREDGGILDDVLVYRLGQGYLLAGNAVNWERDRAWLRAHATGSVRVDDFTESTAMIAIQGPAAQRILEEALHIRLHQLGPFSLRQRVTGAELLSRTGYTGEDGFEVVVPHDAAIPMWQCILSTGEPRGLRPAGLGARDTLRLEAGFVLYGNDIDETVNPFEADLATLVDFQKGDFVGRQALLALTSPQRRLTGLTMLEPGVPRRGQPVCDGGGQVIGTLTSGTYSPTLRCGLGLAYLKVEHRSPGTMVQVGLRGGPARARVTRLPFYRRQHTV